MTKKQFVKDTYSYKGWLNSDNFLKRAFACLGYQAVATLIIYCLVLIVALLIMAIFGLNALI